MLASTCLYSLYAWLNVLTSEIGRRNEIWPAPIVQTPYNGCRLQTLYRKKSENAAVFPVLQLLSFDIVQTEKRRQNKIVTNLKT